MYVRTWPYACIPLNAKCVCACVCVWVLVHVCVCMCVCLSACVCLCWCCVFLCLLLCVRVHACVCVDLRNILVHKYVKVKEYKFVEYCPRTLSADYILLLLLDQSDRQVLYPENLLI